MQQLWKKTAMGIVYSLIIVMVGILLMGFSAAFSLASGIFGSASGFGLFGVLTILFLLAAIGGYVWFFINLVKFKGLQQTESDRSAISNVLVAYILMFAGTILTLIPIAGIFINLVCVIAANVLLIVAYGSFSRSQVMNQMGCNGASNLKVASIVALICGVLTIIPFLNILALLGSIAVIVLQFVGWTKISNGLNSDSYSPQDVY